MAFTSKAKTVCSIEYTIHLPPTCPAKNRPLSRQCALCRWTVSPRIIRPFSENSVEFSLCSRWDSNPQYQLRNEILSLARQPVAPRKRVVFYYITHCEWRWRGSNPRAVLLLTNHYTTICLEVQSVMSRPYTEGCLT